MRVPISGLKCCVVHVKSNFTFQHYLAFPFKKTSTNCKGAGGLCVVTLRKHFGGKSCSKASRPAVLSAMN